LPGVNVDEKTVYKIRLLSLDNETLVKKVYLSFSFKIGTLKADTKVTNELENLAVMAGEWSRFSTDKNLPRNSLTLMYHSWLENSINRKLADEIFIATDPNSKSIIGFITVKQSVSDKYCVSIGLLSVSNEYRRQGIASALLSRAALWALEITGWSDQTFLSVVTQGANGPACSCYEKFGFLKDTIQYVYHAWLPQHLEEPLQRADHGKIPFCKQFLTGKEIENVSQVLASGLDSTSRFTHLCSKVLKEMLGHESKRVVIVPSGTSALEMAALLINIMPGDEIIMPSFTFSSTANAFVLRGGIPVFVDIRPDTLNINEKLIEEAITSRTVAICCVHYGGTPCDMDSICEIVSRHKLYLIEDAAQGTMSKYYLIEYKREISYFKNDLY
jgi:ribosomal protein S18 acetylase RimI-like enzyme